MILNSFTVVCIVWVPVESPDVKIEILQNIQEAHSEVSTFMIFYGFHLQKKATVFSTYCSVFQAKFLDQRDDVLGFKIPFIADEIFQNSSSFESNFMEAHHPKEDQGFRSHVHIPFMYQNKTKNKIISNQQW